MQSLINISNISFLNPKHEFLFNISINRFSDIYHCINTTFVNDNLNRFRNIDINLFSNFIKHLALHGYSAFPYTDEPYHLLIYYGRIPVIDFFFPLENRNTNCLLKHLVMYIYVDFSKWKS